VSEQSERPDVVADLLALTTRLGERLTTARREIDAIDALLARLPGAPVRAPVPAPEPAPPPRAIDPAARTRAIALALDGHDRGEAETRLAGQLEPSVLAAVLDDVFGPAQEGDA
jgi:hypothetical protein